MKRKLSALILGAAALAVGFGSLAVAGVVAHKDAIVQTKAAATTVSMNSFGAVSGNIGGDVNVSYKAEKGSAGTAPAVNGSQIRIYQNGGLLTVTANNQKHLTSVKIGSAMATSVTYTTDLNSTPSSKISIGAGETITVDLSNQEKQIVFKCTGTDKNSRLYLNYLSATYDAAGEATYDVFVSPESDAAEVGTGMTLALTALTDGDSSDTYTWSSSDTSVATVSSDGVVTGVTAGTVTITAASKTHSGKSGSIDITVFETESYQLVTSDLGNYVGTFVIGYGSEVFNGTSGKGNHVTGSLVDDVITVNTQYVLTVASYGSGYSIQTAAGTYLTAETSDKNGLKLESSPTAFSFSVADGDVTITALDSGYNQVLRYNPSDSIFNFYKSSTYTDQKAIQLYQIPDLTTKSISVSSSSVELDKGANSETITITSKNFTADSYEVISSDETVAEAIVDGNSIVISGVAYGTATITVNAYLGGEIVASAEIAVKVNDPDRVLTIAEARQTADKTIVKYSGTIIGKTIESKYGSNFANYYIQEGSKGIQAYNCTDTSFNVGDGVTVTGTKTTFKGIIETTSNTVTLNESAKKTIEAVALTNTKNDDDSTLVFVEGISYSSGTWTSGDAATLKFAYGDDEIQIRVPWSSSADLYSKLDWDNRVDGDTYRLTAIKSFYNDTVQFMLLDGAVLGSSTDETAVDTFVVTYITNPGAEDYTTIAEADRQASCVNKYTAAKAALEALTENQQSLFNYDAKYADAREIYNIWKAAYDAQNGGSGAGMLTFDSKETQNTVLISTLGAAAVVAAAGFIFLKKKRA